MTSSARAPGASLRSLFPDVCFRQEWGEESLPFSHFTLYWFRILHSQHTNLNTSQETHAQAHAGVWSNTNTNTTDTIASTARSSRPTSTKLPYDLHECHAGVKIRPKISGNSYWLPVPSISMVLAQLAQDLVLNCTCS